MTHPKMGGNNYKAALLNIHDEIALCSKILDRLLEPNITSLDKNRLIAQASLAWGALGKKSGNLNKSGKNRKPSPKKGKGNPWGKDREIGSTLIISQNKKIQTLASHHYRRRFP